jgi:hypothetical protein
MPESVHELQSACFVYEGDEVDHVSDITRATLTSTDGIVDQRPIGVGRRGGEVPSRSRGGGLIGRWADGLAGGVKWRGGCGVRGTSIVD